MRHGVPGWFFVVAYILNTRESVLPYSTGFFVNKDKITVN